MGIIERFRNRRSRKDHNDTAVVLMEMSRAPEYDFTGIDLLAVTHLSSGRLYTALARLEDQGRITSRWTDAPKGSRRRLYRLDW